MNLKKSQDLPHFHCIFKSRKRNFWSLRFSFEVVFWRKGGKKKIELKLYKSFSPCNLTLLLTWLDPLFKPNLCQGNNSLRLVPDSSGSKRTCSMPNSAPSSPFSCASMPCQQTQKPELSSSFVGSLAKKKLRLSYLVFIQEDFYLREVLKLLYTVIQNAHFMVKKKISFQDLLKIDIF